MGDRINIDSSEDEASTSEDTSHSYSHEYEQDEEKEEEEEKGEDKDVPSPATLATTSVTRSTSPVLVSSPRLKSSTSGHSVKTSQPTTTLPKHNKSTHLPKHSKRALLPNQKPSGMQLISSSMSRPVGRKDGVKKTPGCPYRPVRAEKFIKPVLSSLTVRDGGMKKIADESVTSSCVQNGSSNGMRIEGKNLVSSSPGLSRGGSRLSSSSTTADREGSGRRSQASYIEQRIGSARRKQANQLRNDIGSLNIKLEELHTENRTLRRIAARQERELARFTESEGEFPVVLKAHNEELRVLRAKMKQTQETNRQLMLKIKEKDVQLFKLRENNKELARVNKDKNLEEGAALAGELEECKARLEDRDNMYREVLHRQDVMERSHRHQLASDSKRRRELQKKLEMAEEKIQVLEKTLQEKEKQIQRLYIYSRRHKTNLKLSSSMGSLPQSSNLDAALERRKKETPTVEDEPDDDLEKSVEIDIPDDEDDNAKADTDHEYDQLSDVAELDEDNYDSTNIGKNKAEKEPEVVTGSKSKSPKSVKSSSGSSNSSLRAPSKASVDKGAENNREVVQSESESCGDAKSTVRAASVDKTVSTGSQSSGKPSTSDNQVQEIKDEKRESLEPSAEPIGKKAVNCDILDDPKIVEKQEGPNGSKSSSRNSGKRSNHSMEVADRNSAEPSNNATVIKQESEKDGDSNGDNDDDESEAQVVDLKNQRASTTVSTKRDFFENLSSGNPKSEEDKKGVEVMKVITSSEQESHSSSRNSTVSMTAQEKVALWLPNNPIQVGTPTPELLENKKIIEPEPKELDPKKKSELLEKLQNIDANQETDNSYLPSFGSPTSGKKDGSESSSDGSGNANRKQKLMRELFGSRADLTINSNSAAANPPKPLKTSFRGSVTSVKSVKFSDDRDEVPFGDRWANRPKTSDNSYGAFS